GSCSRAQVSKPSNASSMESCAMNSRQIDSSFTRSKIGPATPQSLKLRADKQILQTSFQRTCCWPDLLDNAAPPPWDNPILYKTRRQPRYLFACSTCAGLL